MQLPQGADLGLQRGRGNAVRQFNWSILAHKLEMHNFLYLQVL